MQQALPQGGLSTRLHVLVLLASLTFAAATEPSQQNTQNELQQPLLPKSSAQTSSEALTASTGNAPARPERDSGNNKDTAASPWLQECQSLPVCSAPALLETVVPTILGFCPAQPFKVDLSAEHQVSGNDSCASLQNSTLQEIALEAVPQQHERAAAKQPLVSDSSEEERHNFALSKDGAKIVGSNKEAKKTSAILDTDSDTFMKNECKADKWFIIELSQVAKVDAFQLSQYELYSSRVKDFEVRGRQAHPRAQGGDYSKSFNTSGWQLMGKYTAVKMKGSQTFIVAEPAWLKFLQFRFLSHHGSEPMCALNDVLVFGKSAAEDLEDQLSDETLLQDSADVGAAKTARPVTADDVSNTQPGQLQPVLLAAVQGEAGPMDRADASRAAGLQHGALQAGNASGVSKAANEQQAANSTAGSHPQGKQDTEQRASGQLQQPAPSDTSDVSPSNVELENEALLQAAPLIAEEAKAAIKAEVRAEQSEELLLPHNSAGSAKSRHGGSIYDMLVQEIKSLKLQQKQAPRQLAELQRNLSVHMERTAAELTALDQTVKGLQADLDLMRRIKSHDVEDSSTALATLADVDVDLRAVLAQLESMQRALHQVQHRVTAIVLLAIIAWLGVVVLTAPALGQLTWILWIPICFIAAIGILWLMPCIFRILPGNL